MLLVVAAIIFKF